MSYIISKNIYNKQKQLHQEGGYEFNHYVFFKILLIYKNKVNDACLYVFMIIYCHIENKRLNNIFVPYIYFGVYFCFLSFENINLIIFYSNNFI